MRGYWIRIALGALAVFVVGMVGVWIARSGMGKVREVTEGSDPIRLPLAFIPFKLDGQRLGTLHQLTINRSTPKAFSGLDLVVDLNDSVTPQRFEGCLLGVRDLEGGHGKVDVKHLDFHCHFSPSDTAGSGLVPFGHVWLRQSGDSFPLLIPQDVAEDLRKGGGDEPFDSDSFAEEMEQMHDSIEEAAERAADSARAAVRARMESLQGRRRP